MNDDDTDFPEQPQTDISSNGSSSRARRAFSPPLWFLALVVGLRLAGIAACVASPDHPVVVAAAPGVVVVNAVPAPSFSDGGVRLGE